jgi:hypothetical protein
MCLEFDHIGASRWGWRSVRFPAKVRKERLSPINSASNPLPESPASLVHVDVVPQIAIQSSRLRLGEFETHAANGLLQHHPPVSRK